MVKKHRKTKKGAAAYYIVAFSTLILVVIATSFAMVMLSEMNRSSNDELSQSAYDAALTGIEDAKLAFASYRRCVESGATKTGASGDAVNCKNIIKWVEEEKCDSVAKVLGRKITNDTEVDIGGINIGTGTNIDTSTNQAYTCAIIHANLNDYRSTLSAGKTRQTMRAEIGNGATNNVNKIKISWHSVRTDVTLATKNFKGTKVTFGQLGKNNVSVPPTLEVQIVQTGPTFKMADFDKTTASQTNRATLYLVPTIELARAKANSASVNNHNTNATNYIGAAINDTTNRVVRKEVVKTNNHAASNKPFLVYCNPKTTDEFYCSVEIEMPNVIGGSGYSRNNKTFMISVSEPYQTPDTDFAIEFFCGNATCGGDENVRVSGTSSQVKIKNTQVAIDVTGRANDLYRRVETRLESSDTTFGSGFPNYALEVLGSSGASKNMKVQSEHEDSFKF